MVVSLCNGFWSEVNLISVARPPLALFMKSQLFSLRPISFHACPFIFPSHPLSTSCVTLVLLHPIAHKLTRPHTLVFISSHTAPNYGVKRSINRKKRRSQHVKYQTGQLERSGGDKRGEEGRRREEEGTSYWNGNRTGQLKHFTGSLFASPAQLSQIIYTAHYGVMNMYKLNSSIITPPLGLN